jgi:sugar phosphate isomerase/epimerase
MVDWTPDRAQKIKGWLDSSGVKISSLGNYDNMLHEDFEVRTRNQEHLRKVIDAAADLGVEYVGTFAGRNMNLSEEQNMKLFEESFVGLVHYAKQKGVKLMFENCPMEGWRPGEERQIQSISWSPQNWVDMFGIMEKYNLGDSLGLNLDPSHLTWLGMDPIETVYLLAEAGYADKIFHVHAKDIKIDRDVKMVAGNLGDRKRGMEWNREYGHKVPGTVLYRNGGAMGTPSPREYTESVYWSGFVSALRDVGFKGVISFEHEDHGSYKTAKLDELQAKAAESDPSIQIKANSALRKEALSVAKNFLSTVMKETQQTRYIPNLETYAITTEKIN